VTADGQNEQAYVLRAARPTWSGDGRWLAGADERGRVCVVQLGKPRARVCLPLRGQSYDPAWRPSRAAARGRR
jgi:Tol biopolymer transport system component